MFSVSREGAMLHISLNLNSFTMGQVLSHSRKQSKSGNKEDESLNLYICSINIIHMVALKHTSANISDNFTLNCPFWSTAWEVEKLTLLPE